jgi:hypothetical protein
VKNAKLGERMLNQVKKVKLGEEEIKINLGNYLSKWGLF